MMEESSYPYTARDGNCDFDGSKTVATPEGFTEVQYDSVTDLKNAIAEGPVSVRIAADSFVFQFYSGGILNSKECGIGLNHGVLIVGYGYDASNKPYYIVRNSWGASWGMAGYVNIAIVAGHGICGIQMEPVFPFF